MGPRVPGATIDVARFTDAVHEGLTLRQLSERFGRSPFYLAKLRKRVRQADTSGAA